MTRHGHGLPMPQGGFANLRVGVLASGFFPQWMEFLGHDTSGQLPVVEPEPEKFDEPRELGRP